MRRLVIVGTVFLAALSTAAAARAQGEPGRCSYTDFVENALDRGAEVYRVMVPGRSYFHNDGDGCPGAVACQLKSYVVGKNRVLVSKVEKGWACAWYGGTSSQTVGWLRAADLAKASTPAGKVTWLGQWSRDADSDIAITRDAHGGLHVDANTVNTRRPSTPSGGFEGDLMVDGPTGVYSDFDAEADARFKAQFPGESAPAPCVARFRRADRYLIVSDTDQCNGVGATSMGVYTR